MECYIQLTRNHYPEIKINKLKLKNKRKDSEHSHPRNLTVLPRRLTHIGARILLKIYYSMLSLTSVHQATPRRVLTTPHLLRFKR